MEVMPDKVVPMNFFMTSIIAGYYKLGDMKKAGALTERLYTVVNEDLTYLFSFPDAELKSFDLSLQEDLMTLDKLQSITTEYKLETLHKKIEPSFQKYYQLYLDKVYQK
jgi:hypothetical protein